MDKDELFEKMLQFVLEREGGYVNDPDDIGKATNRGITTGTYNSYRRSKNLPIQDVRNITNDEVRDIYYNNYYKASGADQLENPRLGMYVFDSAVNMGVGTAKEILKQSGENLDNFEKIRRDKYQTYANAKKNQMKYLDGWMNRVGHAKDFAQNSLPETRQKPFKMGVEMTVDKNGNVMDYYNMDDIKNMSGKEIINNLPTLKDQAIHKLGGKPTGFATGTQQIQTPIIPTVHMGPQKASERLKGLSLDQLTKEELDELLEELI